MYSALLPKMLHTGLSDISSPKPSPNFAIDSFIFCLCLFFAEAVIALGLWSIGILEILLRFEEAVCLRCRGVAALLPGLEW